MVLYPWPDALALLVVTLAGACGVWLATRDLR